VSGTPLTPVNNIKFRIPPRIFVKIKQGKLIHEKKHQDESRVRLHKNDVARMCKKRFVTMGSRRYVLEEGLTPVWPYECRVSTGWGYGEGQLYCVG
jgi:hypothetical protein